MKNKHPWKLLRCIGIAPWKIASGEQRFIFDGPNGGTDTPDGGASGESEDGGAETKDDTDAGEEAPVDTDITIQAGARLVEAGQNRLSKSAESSYENSVQAVERFVNSLTSGQREDREISNVIDKALDELRRGQWIDTPTDRKDILDQVRADVTEIIEAQTPAAHEDENAPPPAGEAEEEGEAEILPPTAPAAHTEAIPKRPRLTDKERIARAIKIGKVDRDKIAKALDISDADKTDDAKLVAAVKKFQQGLWETATPADKKKFEARYKNAKGFGDGIWGQDTQALFETVAKYADGKDGGFKEKLAKLNPAAAPLAAPTAAEAAPAAPPPAAAEVVTPLPDLPVASKPAFKNGPLKADIKNYQNEAGEFRDEYEAKKGNILILYVDIKDANGNTLFPKGTPVIVAEDPQRKDDKNVAMRVSTADGKSVLDRPLSAEDELEEPDETTVQAFIDKTFERKNGEWLAKRRDDIDHLYDRDVVFINAATDSNGNTIKPGTKGTSEFNDRDGYTVTIQGNIHRFNIARGKLPVKDVRFDVQPSPLQYAKLKNDRIFVFQQGEKTGIVIPTQVASGEVVMILGKTDDGGYMIRTKDGVEGYIVRGSILEETRVARTVGQTTEQIVAAVEAKAAPPAAVAAAAPAAAALPTAPPVAPPPTAAAMPAPTSEAARRPVFPAGAAPPAAPPAPAA